MVFLHEFGLEGQQTLVVVVSEGEAGRRAAAWNLKLVDDLLPQLSSAHLHRASANVYRLKQLAEVKLLSANAWHLEVFVPKLPLELDELLLEAEALDFLILLVQELQALRSLEDKG